MMKRTIFLTLCLVTLTVTAQKVMIPGKGGIDVERLNKPVNLNMDISQLNVTELRVLRNSFWARKGYAFSDAFLRGVFQNTSWYSELMWKAWESEDSGQSGPLKVVLTADEQAFVAKLQAREKELTAENFQPKRTGWTVNMENVVNAMQIEQLDKRLEDRLGSKGFAIVPAKEEQLFHIYEKNDYSNFPNFVTTDLYLQLYHLYFDCLLRDVEQHKLFHAVQQLSERGLQLTAGGSTAEHRWLHTYFEVASCLLQGQKGSGTVADEVSNVTESSNAYSDYLGYTDVVFPYSLFRPRGHYTRNDSLSRYFRSMMWLQTVPFGTDKPSQLKSAVLLAELVGSDTRMSQLYQKIAEPITWLFGMPDNITIMQVYELMKQQGMTATQFFAKPKAMDQLRTAIEQLAEKQTRIRPKFEYSSRYKINLMPQRYMPDAEVMQEMVDYDNNPTQRAVPTGLDIMASLGVESAENILLNELKQGQQWNGFVAALETMKRRMQQIDWNHNIGTRWISALKTVMDVPQGAPYFMLSNDWQKKELNAALASWAELKHDAILYAKQPFGAECGGGGPPEPVVKGYVEPNIAFWQQAIDLLDATAGVLKKYDFMPKKGEQVTTRMREEAQFLLAVSQKELAGKRLSDEEYGQIERIGAAFENISLDLVREPDKMLYGWDDVQGADRKVALIADVYTASAFNNPDKSILYAAVGMADEIYVIVEVEGYLYLMRGGVLSYRELQRPMNMQRLTDEEWQKNLETSPDDGRPVWMDEILLPLKETPKANEKYFYSTGC